MVLIATLLPWAGYRGTAVSWSFPAGFAANGIAGILVYVFGLFWLTFFAVPRKRFALLGIGWGGAAFLLTLLTILWIASLSDFFVESGVYVSLLGCLLLILGSAFAYAKAPKPIAPGPASWLPPAPPSP